MIKVNSVNNFLRGCSDHRDQLLDFVYSMVFLLDIYITKK